jgi:hypothetical protein
MGSVTCIVTVYAWGCCRECVCFACLTPPQLEELEAVTTTTYRRHALQVSGDDGHNCTQEASLCYAGPSGTRQQRSDKEDPQDAGQQQHHHLTAAAQTVSARLLPHVGRFVRKVWENSTHGMPPSRAAFRLHYAAVLRRQCAVHWWGSCITYLHHRVETRRFEDQPPRLPAARWCLR